MGVIRNPPPFPPFRVATLALRLRNDKGHRRVTLLVGDIRAIVEFQMNARLNEPLESHHMFNSTCMSANNEAPWHLFREPDPRKRSSERLRGSNRGKMTIWNQLYSSIFFCTR